MSLEQKVRLKLKDGTEVIAEYNAIDLCDWEELHDDSVLGVQLRLSMLRWLGWHAARRDGLINGAYDTFDKFAAVCVDVGIVSGEEPVPMAAAKKAATPKGP